MSETPGHTPPPRDNRGGGRPRNNNRSNNRNRRPRNEDRRGEQRREPHSDDRGPRRRDDRRDNRPPRKGPASPVPTLWQKVLAILTFGLVRPKTAAVTRPPRPDQPARPPREPKASVAVPAADPEAVDNARLHIGNLHYDASESDLMDLFKGVGPVTDVDIVYNGRTHRSKGFGFVQMATLADARRAVADLHGKPFMGRPLVLGPARSRGEDKREADEE